MCTRVRVIVTGKLLCTGFFGNKISESEQDFRNFQKYLSPKISCYTVNEKFIVHTVDSIASRHIMYLG